MQPLLGCYFYKCAHLIAGWGWLVRGHRADDFASPERTHNCAIEATIVCVTHTIVTTRRAMQQTHRRLALARYCRPPTRNVQRSTLASRLATRRARTSYWSFGATARRVAGKRLNTSIPASVARRTSDPLSMSYLRMRSGDDSTCWCAGGWIVLGATCGTWSRCWKT